MNEPRTARTLSMYNPTVDWHNTGHFIFNVLIANPRVNKKNQVGVFAGGCTFTFHNHRIVLILFLNAVCRILLKLVVNLKLQKS